MDKIVDYNLIVSLLNRQVSEAKLTKSTAVSLRTTLSRVLKTVYRDNWLDTNIAQLEPDELFEKYEYIVAEKYSKRALSVARSRLRRTFKLMREEFGVALGYNDNAELVNSIEALRQSISAVQTLFMPNLRNTFRDSDGLNDYNIYAVPVDLDKIAGLLLPKGLSKNELESIQKMIEGIFVCGKYDAAKKGVF